MKIRNGITDGLPQREIRFCSRCGKALTSGYYAGGDYYCSEKCLPYSNEEWEELYDNGSNDDYYWTEWEEYTPQDTIYLNREEKVF